MSAPRIRPRIVSSLGFMRPILWPMAPSDSCPLLVALGGDILGSGPPRPTPGDSMVSAFVKRCAVGAALLGVSSVALSAQTPAPPPAAAREQITPPSAHESARVG